MKTLGTRILIFICLTLSLVSPCVAETPEEVVTKMMDKIKAVGSPAPYLDYVNWDSAYSSLSEEQKTQMKVSSAKELKGTFEQMFTDTESFFRAKFDEKIKDVPASERSMHEAKFKQMVAAIEMQQERMKEQIKNTDYKIGESNVKEDKATVKLTQTYEGQSRDRTIHLTNESGAWLLDSASIFTEEKKEVLSKDSPPPKAPAAK